LDCTVVTEKAKTIEGEVIGPSNPIRPPA